VGHHLPPHCGGGQAGLQTVGAARGGGWALALDEGVQNWQAGGEMRCRPLPPTQGTGLETAHARGEGAPAFAHRPPAPPPCACGPLWPTRPSCLPGAGHKQATGAALEGLGGLA